FPNPAVFGTTGEAFSAVSTFGGFFGEAVGTFFLVMFIFAVVDRHNPGRPHGRSNLAAYFVGFTVAIVISIIAPLTQAGLNPARDFGPRLVAFLAGWGDIAIPGPREGFWVYILGPVAGGLVGAFAYDQLIRRFHVAHPDAEAAPTRADA
ncbi:MAG: aquaporin, partial [Armatimonadota bacterium]